MRAILLVHPAFLHELSRLGVAYSKTHTGLDCKRFLSNRIDRDFPLITKKKKETLISHFLSAPLVTSMQLIENRSVRYTGDQKSGCGSIVRHLIFVETLIAWSLVTSPCRKPKKIFLPAYLLDPRIRPRSAEVAVYPHAYTLQRVWYDAAHSTPRNSQVNY